MSEEEEREEPSKRLSIFSRLRNRLKWRYSSLVLPISNVLTLSNSGSKILASSRRFGSADEASARTLLEKVIKTMKSTCNNDEFAVFDCGSNASRLLPPRSCRHVQTFPQDHGLAPRVDVLLKELQAVLNWIQTGCLLDEESTAAAVDDPAMNTHQLLPQRKMKTFTALILCGNNRHWAALLSLISFFRNNNNPLTAVSLSKFKLEINRMRSKRRNTHEGKGYRPSEDFRLETCFRLYPTHYLQSQQSTSSHPSKSFQSMKLVEVILNHAPKFDELKQGCRPYLLVTDDADHVIYSSLVSGIQSYAYDQQVKFNVNRAICGDFRLKFFNVSSNDDGGGGKEMCSLWFHSGDLENIAESGIINLCEFNMKRIDRAMERDDRFSDNEEEFKIGLIIVNPVCRMDKRKTKGNVCVHCFSWNSQDSQRCGKCKESLGSFSSLLNNVTIPTDDISQEEEQEQDEEDSQDDDNQRGSSYDDETTEEDDKNENPKVLESLSTLYEMFPGLVQEKAKVEKIRRFLRESYSVGNNAEHDTAFSDIINQILLVGNEAIHPSLGNLLVTPFGLGTFHGENVCNMNDGNVSVSYKVRFSWGGVGYIQPFQCEIVQDKPQTSKKPVVPPRATTTTSSRVLAGGIFVPPPPGLLGDDEEFANYEEMLDAILARSLQAEFDGLGPVHRGGHSTSISSLPVHTYSRKKSVTGSKSSVSEQDSLCMVCQHPFKQGEQVRTLPCFHTFHVECVDTWLFQKGKCPLCKTDITEHV